MSGNISRNSSVLLRRAAVEGVGEEEEEEEEITSFQPHQAD